MSTVPEVAAEYDLVIAGGGTAACVIAGRLAAASPELKILVLEAGPGTKDSMNTVQPARFLANFLPTSDTVRFHIGAPTEAVGGRPIVVIAGQCVGGGSAVNFGMYTRGSASDYDTWEKAYENPGWGFKDLLPLFQKTETYQVNPEAMNHGNSGPLKISYGGIFTSVGKDFLHTVGKVDPSRAWDDGHDATDFHHVNVFNRWRKWINQDNGHRSDAAHHFVYNLDNNNGLNIVTGANVKRVIFDGDKATGVEFTWNARIRPDAPTTPVTVTAKKMVVVSGGAFGSPAVLERSGVGSKAILEKFGIPVKVDLEGVGHDYQDHNIVFMPYHASPESETLDAVMRGEASVIQEATPQWEKDGKGILGTNGVDIGARLRPTAEELKSFGKEFNARWANDFAPFEDKPPLWIGGGSMLIGDPTRVPPQKYYSLAVFNCYPVARGSTHITSADDVGVPTDFKPGFVEDMADVTPLMFGYKYTREIARRMSCFRGEVAAIHPKYPLGSKAGLSDKPAPIDAPPLEYSEEDDKAVETYIRAEVATCWHSLGTCAMKPRDQKGVVDSKLNVYGVKGLKVADMSICPSNVGANTYSTSLVVGEKAAVIIAEELGITL